MNHYFDPFIPKGFRVIRRWTNENPLPPSSYTYDTIIIRPSHRDALISSGPMEEYNELSDLYEWNDKWEGASRFSITHDDGSDFEEDSHHIPVPTRTHYGIEVSGVYFHARREFLFDQLSSFNRQHRPSGIFYEMTYKEAEGTSVNLNDHAE